MKWYTVPNRMRKKVNLLSVIGSLDEWSFRSDFAYMINYKTDFCIKYFKNMVIEAKNIQFCSGPDSEHISGIECMILDLKVSVAFYPLLSYI